MIDRKPAVFLVLCLALVPLAAAEEPALEALPAAAPAVSTAPALCSAPVGLLDAPQAPVLLAAAGSCTATADCRDGSHVTCSASGSSAQCSFIDSDCPDVRGSCWSSDQGTKWCPPCPCTAPACSLYEGRKCSPGTQSPTCSEGNVCAHCICTSLGKYICP